jgi:dihydroorotase-like cyclic amidohydrolase
MKLKGSPVATIINGSIKMIEGKVLEKPNGKVINFD